MFYSKITIERYNKKIILVYQKPTKVSNFEMKFIDNAQKRPGGEYLFLNSLKTFCIFHISTLHFSMFLLRLDGWVEIR